MEVYIVSIYPEEGGKEGSREGRREGGQEGGKEGHLSLLWGATPTRRREKRLENSSTSEMDISEMEVNTNQHRIASVETLPGNSPLRGNIYTHASTGSG